MKHPKDVRYDARPARSKLIPCGLEGGSVALCVGELEDMASPPGLLTVAREKMRTRHLALRTEHAYLQWLRRYLVFHGRRHPRHLGAPEVEQFLTHLAVHRKVSAATQNQALQALLFLYRHVLQIELPWLDNITRASHPRRRPVVLSRAEVRSLLSQLQGAPWLVANLLYGSGLRLMEALRLRVKDLALERGELIVREAKGGKDRVTVLPAVLDPPLRGHLTRLLLGHADFKTTMVYLHVMGKGAHGVRSPSTGKAGRRDPQRSRTGVCEPANRFCRHAS